MLNRDDILAVLRALHWPTDAYWVMTGAALVLHGVREGTRDIDVGCTGEHFEALARRGWTVSRTSDGTRKAAHADIEAIEEWRAERVEWIEGFPVATLASVRAQKLALGRAKDAADVALIDAALGAGDDPR